MHTHTRVSVDTKTYSDIYTYTQYNFLPLPLRRKLFSYVIQMKESHYGVHSFKLVFSHTVFSSFSYNMFYYGVMCWHRRYLHSIITARPINKRTFIKWNNATSHQIWNASIYCLLHILASMFILNLI